MKLLQCNDSNNNTQFLIDMINKTKYSQSSNYYWVLSEVELIPLFHGDYIGDGGAVSDEISYNFMRKHETEKISIMFYDKLICLLKDTQAIRNGVFVCFANNIAINKKTFRPRVECSNPDKICHENAELEIRILDGDLFYILNGV